MNGEQARLEDYARTIAEAARDAGLQAVEASDPDLFDEAVSAIIELARRCLQRGPYSFPRTWVFVCSRACLPKGCTARAYRAGWDHG